MRKALLIANGRYTVTSGFRELVGPRNDIEALARVLGSDGPGKFEVTSLLDADKNTITDTITALMDEVGPRDFVLVHYSGHGQPGRKRDLYIAASDSNTDALLRTAVPVITIWAAAKDSRCERFLFVFDCCFSGAALRAWTRGEAEVSLRQLGEETGEGTHVIASSSELLTSEEREVDTNGTRMGLLTHALVAGIETGNAARNDGQVTLASLLEHLTAALPEQKPKYWGSGDPSQLVIASHTERLSIANEDRVARIARWAADGLITDAERHALTQVVAVHKGVSDLDLPEITRIVSLLDARQPRPDATIAMLRLTFPESLLAHSQNEPDRQASETGPSASPSITRDERPITPVDAIPPWSPAQNRRDPISLLVEAETNRIAAFLPIRYSRMRTSPAAFFRGALAVMAHDLGMAPASNLLVQAIGDCTLWNFATFPTADGGLVFDISDFSQTAQVPFEFDLKRLMVSIMLEGRSTGVGEKKIARIINEATRRYCKRIRRLAIAGDAAALRSRIDVALEVESIREDAVRKMAKKWLRDSLRRGQKGEDLVELIEGKPHLRERPPTLVHLASEEAVAWQGFEKYRSELGDARSVLLEGYELRDVCFRFLGVGSVGAFNAVGLFVDGRGSTLLLELREVMPSVFGDNAAGAGVGDAERMVTGQRAIQAVPDRFLSSVVVPQDKRELYVRRLSGGRLDQLRRATVTGEWLPWLSRLCAHTLASAHARSGKAEALASYVSDIDSFVNMISNFARDYAGQVEKDWTTFFEGMRSGYLPHPAR